MKKTLLWVCFLGVLLIAALFAHRHLTNPLTPQEREYLRKMKHIADLYGSAQKYGKKSKFKKAIESYRQILVLVPNDIDAKVLLATHLAWDTQYEEAEKIIQEVLKEKPDHIEAQTLKKNIYTWKENYNKDMEEKTHAEKIKRLNDLFESAKKYSSKNKFKQAIQNYREILTLTPTDIDVKVFLATHLAWDKQYKEAEKIIQEILKEKPAHIEAKIILGNIYAWQENYQKSLEIIHSLLNEYPQNEAVLMALTNVYRWKGDKEKAIETARKILKINPRNADALKLLEQSK